MAPGRATCCLHLAYFESSAISSFLLGLLGQRLKSRNAWAAAVIDWLAGIRPSTVSHLEVTVRLGSHLHPTCQQALRREGPHLCIPTAMVSWAQGDGTGASGRRREAEVGAGTSFIYLGEMGLDFPICDVVWLGGRSHIAMESFLKLLPLPRV